MLTQSPTITLTPRPLASALIVTSKVLSCRTHAVWTDLRVLAQDCVALLAVRAPERKLEWPQPHQLGLGNVKVAVNNPPCGRTIVDQHHSSFAFRPNSNHLHLAERIANGTLVMCPLCVFVQHVFVRTLLTALPDIAATRHVGGRLKATGEVNST